MRLSPGVSQTFQLVLLGSIPRPRRRKRRKTCYLQRGTSEYRFSGRCSEAERYFAENNAIKEQEMNIWRVSHIFVVKKEEREQNKPIYDSDDDQ